MHDLRIAELLSTRLCHDLTGPIGAVNNGVEFLSDDDSSMMDQALELIAASAREAVRRIKFYRQAYGKVNLSGEANLEELKFLTDQFLSGTKISLDWPDQYTAASGVGVSRRVGKLLMNMIIIATESLIRGGTLSVRLEKAGEGIRLKVLAVGRGARLERESQEALASTQIPLETLTPKTVQPFLTARLAEQLESKLQFTSSEDLVELSLEKASA